MRSNEATPGITEITPETASATEALTHKHKSQVQARKSGLARRDRMTTKTGPGKYLDELRIIEAMVDQHLSRFGLSPEQVRTKRPSEKVKLVLDGAFGAMSRIHRTLMDAAEKAGVDWARRDDLVTNAKNVLNVMTAKVQRQPTEGGLSDAELLRLATSINEMVEFKLSKLPPTGTEAIRLVLPLLQRQVLPAKG